MLPYIDYVQQSFFAASRWDRDNSYGALTATARAILDFPTPNGLTLNFSSLASPNFATSYSLANTGTVDGSLAYLYSSLPLHVPSKSNEIPLRRLVPGYRQLRDDYDHARVTSDDPAAAGRALGAGKSLLYGRMYLPTSHLEALYLRRLSATTQVKAQAVSHAQLRSGGSVLFLLSRDVGRHSTEWLYSTDSALLGVRGLYNFGADPPTPSQDAPRPPSSMPRISPAPLNGRFSAGAELYYGLLNKSGGISTGLRFATLPRHPGFPYTMTLTLNPLMGNLSSTYSVRTGQGVALSSRFDFNFYSYESGYTLGVELWRRRRPGEAGGRSDGLEWARRKLREPGRGGWGEPPLEPAEGSAQLAAQLVEAKNQAGAALVPGSDAVAESLFDNPTGFANEDTEGVLKARVNHHGAVGLLWEGRVKHLLCSFGVNVDFRRKEQIFRGLGLEVSYSS